MIFGSYQSIEPAVQWRACFEIPEMCSSDLLDVVSASCWPILVRKETRVWPTYFASWLQLHDRRYTPFLSIGSGRVLLVAHRRLPNLGPGLEWTSTSFWVNARFSWRFMLATYGMDA